MSERDANASEIPVLSKDPEKPAEDEKKSAEEKKVKVKDDESDRNDMSEEDLQLKAELDMLVERLKEPDTDLYLPALETLRTLIRTSTSSMTSVPKPLKFLRPHYEELGKIRSAWSESLVEQRSLLASILSVLAMTYSDTGRRETLYFRILSESTEAPGLWGHEYVRHLAAELGEEYVALTVPDEVKPVPEATDAPTEANGTSEPEPATVPTKRDYTVDQLRELGLELVGFFLSHNAEVDAVDLLLELECVDRLEDKVDDKTYPRVCQYMVSCVPLLVPPDDNAFLRTAAAIYAKHDRYPEALALAIRLHDRPLVRKYFEAPSNPVMKKQLAFVLARAMIPLHWVHGSDSMQAESEEVTTSFGGEPPALDEDLLKCLGNQNLSTHFRSFGKAVGVDEPRTVEDIYKSHLESRQPVIQHDSARQNLATTFVNAFVNAGFGNETLVANAPEGQSFIYKTKAEGMLSATASVGLSLLWDHEGGVDSIDTYTYSSEEHIKAGAMLATGILFSGVRTDPDLCFALIEEHIDNPSPSLKVSVLNALGIAYAGSGRQDIAARILPYVTDETNTMEIAANAALSLGFIFVGSADGDIAGAILQTIMEREPAQFESEWTMFLGLALGLIYLGRQDECDVTIETLKVIEHPMARSAETLVDVCAYAGTGNVLKIQAMLHTCAEHAVKPKKEEPEEPAAPAAETAEATAPATDAQGDVAMEDAPLPAAAAAAAAASAITPEAEDDTPPEPIRHQAVAVIGIALVAMGEEVGAEMALRQFQHLMTYGDPIIRKSVPLALALISASNPQLSILDTLSKYSHDSDLDVAANAIIAMGLVGAGTNNARLAQMLRQLAVYYAKEPDCFFLVRIAQGFVHMGKGTIGISPFFNDHQTMSRTAVAGLLALIVSFTDAKNFVLGKRSWMLYYLVMAMYPQFLIMLGEDGEEKAVTVRVGQAVNTVGTAGTRSGIAGFQTHQTPVRIGTTERAELGTNEFFPYSSVLEGFVFIKKNEQYDAED